MFDRKHNQEEVSNEFRYLELLIDHRLSQYFTPDQHAPRPVFPEIGRWELPMQEFIISNGLTVNEATLLLIALVPHVQPQLFDRIIENRIPDSGNFPRIGGVRGKNSRNFLPTGDTALFLLAGDDLESRLEAQQLFNAEHLFNRHKILWLEELPLGEPAMSGKIIISQDFIDLFTTNKISQPHFGANFPAEALETLQDWNDLVLAPETMKQVEELELWLRYGQVMLYDLNMIKKLKPGFRVLFHGPPGTGKTLTASLLGKKTGKKAYKIDLSMIVSKYIGETEKNLANLFDRAENKQWILFFDEADALFGKRTNVKDAHDKYANQEVSYLLQRVENYNGLVILASNFKNNIDESFTRRFQSHIYFPLPKYNERLLLWKGAFPAQMRPDEQVDMNLLARQYELTGAHIMNIIQFACLQALSRGEKQIRNDDILEGIRKEYIKEGKLVS
jgi:hypothetical protein